MQGKAQHMVETTESFNVYTLEKVQCGLSSICFINS